MTERVDMDRLADFVGGALDGTPDAAEVRRLIDNDPGWATAHADLTDAMSLVTADLRTVGSRPEAIPEDVVARLDAVLRPLDSSDGTTAATGARTGTATDSRPGPTRPAGRSGGTGPGRRTHSRRARLAAGLSAVVAVAAIGFGCSALLPSFPIGQYNSTNSGGDAARNQDAPAAAPLPAGGPIPVVSDRDYAPGSFAGLGAIGALGGGATDRDSRAVTGGAQEADPNAAADVPPELARLVAAGARQACLEAIRVAFGGVPLAVEFARFTGRPALIVLLAGANPSNGRPWVVVVGPNCGRTPGATDGLYDGPLA